MIRLLRLPLAALVLSVALAGCAATQSISPADPGLSVALDGSEAEWTGALNPVAKQPGLAIGARRGVDELNVVVVLRNQRQVRQALSRGLTLWLNSTGGKDRTLGVRFPLGPEPGAGPRPSGQEGRMTDAFRQRFAAATVDLEVLRDGEDEGVRLSSAGASGIAAAATLDGDILVVEYKIPLGDGVYGLSATPSATFGLGLTTERRVPVGVFAGGTDAAERAEARSTRQSAGSRAQASSQGQSGGAQLTETPLDVWLTVGVNGL